MGSPCVFKMNKETIKVGDTVYTRRMEGNFRSHRVTQVMHHNGMLILDGTDGRYMSSINASRIVSRDGAWYEKEDD